MSAAFCPNCGMARTEGFRYCGSCGLDLSAAQAGMSTPADASSSPPSQWVGPSQVPQSRVSKGRWFAAAITGVGVYMAVSVSTAPMLDRSSISPGLVGAVVGIVWAGRMVGARTARRWILIAFLTFGCILALNVAVSRT